MCNSKCYDVISIVVSLILGIVFAILVFFFPTFYPLGFLFGFLLSLTALLLMTITASSLLRQDKRLNNCICATGKRLLIPALILLAASCWRSSSLRWASPPSSSIPSLRSSSTR